MRYLASERCMLLVAAALLQTVATICARGFDSAPRLFAYTSLGGAINRPARRIKILDNPNQYHHVIIG